MISQETTDLLISINFSYIKKIFNYNVQSVIKTIDINEFTCQNENLLVILISTLQCLFISKDIDIENKNNLVLQSIGIFEKLIEQLNTYREKYLRIISLFYYEILYYINLLPNEKISLELKDETIYVECQNHKTYIKGIGASDFPVIPEVSKNKEYKLKSSDLKKALNQVMFAVTLDESRPEISGVLFDISNKILTLAGTDSYRLAEKRIALLETSGEENKIIVPLRTLQELSRILSETSKDEILLYINDSQIMFVLNEEVELISRLIEGQYPDYQQIIPIDNKTKTKVRVEELSRIIKSVSLFCKPGVNDVKFNLIAEKNELIVSAANSGVGENTVNLSTEVIGIDNEVVFNYRYFLDGLSNLGEEEVILELISDNAPGVMRAEKNGDYLYIVMPIKQ